MVVFTKSVRRLILRHLIISGLLFGFFKTHAADAAILSEAYSKVMLSGVHVGYTIQRYEFDQAKKEFVVTYYVKTGPNGGNLTESVKARSTASLKPVSYQYTQLVGDKAKMLDATFKNDTMSITVIENGARRALAPRKIPKDVFLASFLGYMMLQGKEGIKPQVKYTYKAIAEEDGQIYDGEAFIAAEEPVSGVPAYKVLNTFMKANFIYWITPKGEFISSRAPVQQIATEVVSTIQEATGGLPLNSSNLTQLFGSVPKGTENAVARKNQGAPLGAPAVGSSASPAPIELAPVETSASPKPTKQQIIEGSKANTIQEDAGKKQGIPGGKGLQLKGSQKPDPGSSH